MNSQDPPNGMMIVSKEEFYRALEADNRDIMPSVRDPYITTWETRDRVLWGWMSTGWKSQWDEQEICAVFPQSLEKIKQ